MPAVYLDHNATTPLDPRVARAMTPFLSEWFGNPHSPHETGRTARAAVEDAREETARALACDPDEVIFTSGGTEADNLALRGVMLAARQACDGRAPGPPLVLVTSGAEHPAVVETAQALAREGFPLVAAACSHTGAVTVAALEEALDRAAEIGQPALVSLMLANNETGALSPARELAALAHSRGALFHTDAVQALGKAEVSFRNVAADLLSISAHKIGGPKGAGALLVKRGTPLIPAITGGTQERGLRGGTVNVPAVVGLGEAVALAVRERAANEARVAALAYRLLERASRAAPAMRVNGPTAGGARLAGTWNLRFPGWSGEEMLVRLDLRGVHVSLGAACHSMAARPSHVLLAMGLSEEEARSSVRFSLGPANTEEEMDYVADVLEEVLSPR